MSTTKTDRNLKLIVIGLLLFLSAVLLLTAVESDLWKEAFISIAHLLIAALAVIYLLKPRELEEDNEFSEKNSSNSNRNNK